MEREANNIAEFLSTLSVVNEKDLSETDKVMVCLSYSKLLPTESEEEETGWLFLYELIGWDEEEGEKYRFIAGNVDSEVREIASGLDLKREEFEEVVRLAVVRQLIVYAQEYEGDFEAIFEEVTDEE